MFISINSLRGVDICRKRLYKATKYPIKPDVQGVQETHSELVVYFQKISDVMRGEHS